VHALQFSILDKISSSHGPNIQQNAIPKFEESFRSFCENMGSKLRIQN